MLDLGLVRYFLCFRVVGEVADEMHGLRRALGVGGAWVPCDRLHLTLQITPEYAGPQPALVEAYEDALDGLDLPACSVVLDQFIGNGYSVVLRPGQRLGDAHELQRLVADHLALRGVPARPGTRFAPHVTLAYDKTRRVLSSIDPISWKPVEVALIESWIGRREHRLLRRWPVGKPALLASAVVARRPEQGLLPF